MNDPHHCRCFTIDDIQNFKKVLLGLGFKDGVQENHGQEYGYALRVEDKLQHHIKVMPNGNIESEMEPPPAYPKVHVDQKYSYSAHMETEQVLCSTETYYGIQNPIPDTCINPKIIKPDKPTHVKEYAAGAGIAGGIIAIVYKIWKDRKNNFR